MLNRLRLVAAGAALVMSASLTAASSATAEPVAPEAKEKRTITIKGVEPRENVFFAKGRVFPSYEKRPAIMQRKLKSATKWGNWKRFKTNGKSRYRVRVAALNRTGTVCYRVKVKGNKKFRVGFSGEICIETIRT